MSLDVSDLKAFYLLPQGVLTRKLIWQALHPLITPFKGSKIAGIGYALPYIGLFRGDDHTSVHLMPAQLGARPWPTGRPSRTALIEESHFPLSDNSLDFCLCVHCLEHSRNVEGLLDEIWRFMHPQGRVAFVTPNRLSAWVQSSNSPFSHGHPFTALQLNALLVREGFTILHQSTALRFPPVAKKPLLQLAAMSEGVAKALHLPFGGVHITFVQKQVPRPITPKRARIFVPQLSPAFP